MGTNTQKVTRELNQTFANKSVFLSFVQKNNIVNSWESGTKYHMEVAVIGEETVDLSSTSEMTCISERVDKTQ